MAVFKKYVNLIKFMAIYGLLCILIFIKYSRPITLYLAWNIFLAIIPLFFIALSKDKFEAGKRGRTILFMLLWLFFFPNSIYLLTDFIHLSNDVFYELVGTSVYSRTLVYAKNIVIWSKLLMMGLAYLFAILVGYESLSIFQELLGRLTTRNMSKCGVVLVSILSGIGIYIGRFLRFNSWDIVTRPWHIIKELIVSIDWFALEFITEFTVFILLGYYLYISFKKIICYSS